MVTEANEHNRLKLQITLPRLSDAEVAGLVSWARLKASQERYLPLVAWLDRILTDEIERRTSPDSFIEPRMEPVPPFRPRHLAEVIMGAFSLSRIALTERQGEFVDNLLLTVLVEAYGALLEFDEALKPYFEAEPNE